MANQVLGVASVAVVVLAYLLVVEAMAAAIVVLAEFITLRVRSLRGQLGQSRPPTAPAREVNQARADGDGQPYRVGGGLMRW